MSQMEESPTPLEQLREIRSLMERSSRFLSLSGLSGIGAGVFALAGAAAAYAFLGWRVDERHYVALDRARVTWFLLADAALVLGLSLATAVYFTTRQARRRGQRVWDSTSRRLLVNLLIPLAVGGVFCLALARREPALVAPATLIFYGLALVNGSKFTLPDIRTLGFCQIALGLVSAFVTGYSLLFWSVGFGLLHILYGTLMWRKYEK